MQYFWINKQEKNKKIIVFFNGWAMNESAVSHMNYNNCDILMLFDYRDFNFSFDFINLDNYEEKYLICWSMGVYCANLFEKYFTNFNKKIAINGTSEIINDTFGIPQKIYNITIKLFNNKSCNKFIENMFNGNTNQNIKITQNIEELKKELISIQSITLKNKINYDCAIISTDDKIIPTQNQHNFWANKAKIINIAAPHYPFKNFTNWNEIIC